MSIDSSVTLWINQLKAGSSDAGEKLFHRYLEKLVRLARSKLTGMACGGADEEDVGARAFQRFFQGVQAGRFPSLSDRNDLWHILLMLTEREAATLVQHERRQRRDVRRVQSMLPDEDSSTWSSPLEKIAGREPTPELAWEAKEQCRRLLEMLGSQELRDVAIWKLEGYSNEEIADMLHCVERSVERKLRRIRGVWMRVESVA
jgi:DNA-directed RNA polymerase specialized sigma24 family protein